MDRLRVEMRVGSAQAAYGRAGGPSEVHRIRGLAAKGTVRAVVVVEVDVGREAAACLADGLVGFQAAPSSYLMLFHRALDEDDQRKFPRDVVASAALAVHADGDPVVLQ